MLHFSRGKEYHCHLTSCRGIAFCKLLISACSLDIVSAIGNLQGKCLGPDTLAGQINLAHFSPIRNGTNMRFFLVPIALATLSGCVGSIVSTVVKAPVKVVAKTVDVMTTSQDEADRNRGRKARKAEGH